MALKCERKTAIVARLGQLEPLLVRMFPGGILAGQGEARAVIAGEEPMNSNDQKGWPPFCGLRASS